MARIRKALTAAVTSVAALSAVLVAAPTASAYDGSPCHSPTNRQLTNPYNGLTLNQEVKYCPLWRGNVPVYAGRDANSAVVGYLTYGGSSNWFVYEKQGGTVSLSGGVNNWWASTLADNGQWGWVPEVYFSGGDNYESDAGLYEPGDVACVWPCDAYRPTPPWRA
ncbi:hypothetical protein [Streptomyces sp. NPDC020681]|uniref:hypothetical protein n=1 Tax=Streptomyces sp. NPDC020681 TaxID=3365083 RepID=UPI00378C5113